MSAIMITLKWELKSKDSLVQFFSVFNEVFTHSHETLYIH